MEAVVMGCREPHRGVVGQWRGLARSGLVANWASRRAFRHAGVCCWWAGGLRRCHGVVTSGAKHGGTEGDTLRRFVQVNGRGGTIWDGKHGFSLTGGQVVAGSNPVSPTTFRQVKCYFYVLPKPARPVHLIWCQRRPGITVSLPGTKPTLTCVFCPKSDARMAAMSSRLVVTRKSVDGGRASRSRRNKPLNRAFPSRSRTIGHDCCGPDCHRLVTSGVGRNGRGDFRGPRRFAVSSQPSRPAHDVIAMSRGYQRVALGRRGR